MAKEEDITGGYIAHDFVTEYYDYIFRHLQDIDFYTDYAIKSGGPVLELACGSGRITIPIARHGIPVTGIDLSSRMLDICRAKLKTEDNAVGSRVTLVKADIRSFDLRMKFNLVAIPFSSFQLLLDVDSQICCLKTARSHLTPDGVFILSVFNESAERLSDKSLQNEFDITPEFTMPDGRRVFRRFRYVERDYTRQVETKESIFYVTHPDGRRERLVHEFKMRYYFHYECIHLLARCGLVVTDVYGGYNRTPFDAADREGRMIFIARKG